MTQKTEKIIQSWDNRAKAYKELTDKWPIFNVMAERLCGWLPENFDGTVLDLGAGSGLLSAVLLQRFAQAKVLVLEPSPNMMGLARQQLGSLVKAYYLLKAEEADEIKIPCQAVLCSAAFHLMDENRVMASVARVLTPGGCFCFNLWGHSYQDTAAAEILSPERDFMLKGLEQHGERMDVSAWPQSALPRQRILAGFKQAAEHAGLILEEPMVDRDELPIGFFIDFACMSRNWPKPLAPETKLKVLAAARQLSAGITVPVQTVRFRAVRK